MAPHIGADCCWATNILAAFSVSYKALRSALKCIDYSQRYAWQRLSATARSAARPAASVQRAPAASTFTGCARAHGRQGGAAARVAKWRPGFVVDDGSLSEKVRTGLLTTARCTRETSRGITTSTCSTWTSRRAPASPWLESDAYATNQDDVAEAFSAFLANFYYVSRHSGKSSSLPGESYAGKYLRRLPHALSPTEFQ